MRINGLTLPNSFVDAVREGTLKREVGCWWLKGKTDAYGDALETELAEVYATQGRIRRATAELSIYWARNEIYGVDSSDEANKPGFIPDILDFSKIIAFGISADGAPFCFDYREGKVGPSVIWWDDVYWRRIAPNFYDFVCLFDLQRQSTRRRST